MARPTKPFFAPWLGKHITGLCRQPDGRWRIVATGERFREPDERRAVEHFLAQTGQANPGQILVGEAVGEQAPGAKPTWDEEAMGRSLAEQRATGVRFAWTVEGNTMQAGVWVPEDLLWRWFTEQLATRPAYVARKTGVTALAALPDHAVPRPSLKLEALLDLYKAHADVLDGSKRDAVKTFEDFMAITGARTLADLTTPVLNNYRDVIKARVSSPGTVQAYFGRVKWLIAFAKTEGKDPVQIDAALSRMAVLKAPRDRRVHQPTPISPGDFQALYKTAAEVYPDWQPRLLIMLNLCLHFDEALELQWDDINLDAGTFCTRRNKRGRVIRAAMLWPETLAILQKIPRTGSPYIFVSAHGTRFNARGQWKTWNKLRVAAGCPQVQMDDIRDGAYTAACQAPGVDEKFARLLAGHRSHGFQDNYVLRYPAIVKPASDAAYAKYFAVQPLTHAAEAIRVS